MLASEYVHQTNHQFINMFVKLHCQIKYRSYMCHIDSCDHQCYIMHSMTHIRLTLYDHFESYESSLSSCPVGTGCVKPHLGFWLCSWGYRLIRNNMSQLAWFMKLIEMFQNDRAHEDDLIKRTFIRIISLGNTNFRRNLCNNKHLVMMMSSKENIFR